VQFGRAPHKVPGAQRLSVTRIFHEHKCALRAGPLLRRHTAKFIMRVARGATAAPAAPPRSEVKKFTPYPHLLPHSPSLLHLGLQRGSWREFACDALA